MLSQDELSAKTGGNVTSGTIRRIEQARGGSASAYLSTVRRLAEALGVPPSSLTLPPLDIEPIHNLPKIVKDGIDGGVKDVDKPEDPKPAKPKGGTR